MNFVPLIPYLSTAAGFLSLLALLLVIYLRFSMRREIERVRVESAQDASLPETVQEISHRLERLAARIEEIEQQRGPAFEWVPEPASLNLNRRGHVLRLYRRGDSIPQIAAALGLSQGEVELMVKVQGMKTAAANQMEDT
jgi:DNA-binding NarL/FixJ family response regulator